MQKDYAYLKDASFLKTFDQLNIQEQYIKITALEFFTEDPIEEVQGRVMSGTININGDSAVRRTASLTVVADEYENDLTDIDGLFSINKKIYIEKGYLNTTGEWNDYPILWFPQGVFVISTVSISHDVSSATISLQLKDKMCLLNGEVGGVLPASVNFSEYEVTGPSGDFVYGIEGEMEEDINTLDIREDRIVEVSISEEILNKKALLIDTYQTSFDTYIERPTIYQIIQEAVNHFGNEQLGKIIISDLDLRARQVMKWYGNTPLYLCFNNSSYYPTTDENEAIRYYEDFYGDTKTHEEILQIVADSTYEYGRDIGYIYTDFTYPGDLITNAGDSVCTVLDKIKETLGNYEYFYDVYGNFVFQEIKNYLNTTQATVELDNMVKGDYQADMTKGKSVYSFEDGNLISSYSNSPQYNMIKNDFVVWGIRESADGSTFPIRYHLAIDSKPKVGNTYSCLIYTDESDTLLKAATPIKVATKSQLPTKGLLGIFYYVQDEDSLYQWSSATNEYMILEASLENITTADWRTELFLSGTAAAPFGLKSNYYYTELQNEWLKLYNIREAKWLDAAKNDPTSIDFFLDFIDMKDYHNIVKNNFETDDSDLEASQQPFQSISKISIPNIGRRTKVISDNKINCIFAPSMPDIIIINNSSEDFEKEIEECNKKGQPYMQVDGDMYALLGIGGNYNSAYDAARGLLYQYTSYNESISIQAIPIYHLEPNTRVTVRDPASGIYGDFMIKSISLPLDHSGSMSISCNRVLERI